MSFRLTWLRRRSLQAAWDVLSWAVAVPLAIMLRYDFSPPDETVPLGLAIGVIASLSFLVLGLALRLYQGRYVVGSFDEVAGLVVASAVIGVAGTFIALLLPETTFPRSTFLLASGIAAASMLGARFMWRATKHHSALRRPGARTLIYGAGDAGSQIVSLILSDRSSRFQPVGFIDDDPMKAHLRRSGIKVLGTIADLELLVRRLDVEIVLVAIAGIPAQRLLELDRRCATLGARVQVIPTASEIVGGAVRLGDISDVSEEDLLGRRPIRTDEAQITDFLRGMRVLVTGAGGSIGSELARQVLRYRPGRLALLDRDESALHAVQLSLDGSGSLTSQDLILADIRDQDALMDVFREVRPEIVFHAAALKHLTMLERFPAEAWKTNVLGTRNTLQAASEVGTQVFVNISTDKAADPTSVLGFSKLITERLTAGMSHSGHRFVSVRFGNVLGSRGSVIETFRYQISRGGPVTVTDEGVSRYFMTVREAVHLVLQASVLGEPGETLILDMGSPVRIVDIATLMIKRSGREIDIEYTGLREGEKLSEVLLASGEEDLRPLHPLISHTKVPPILSEVLEGDAGSSPAEMMRACATAL